MTNLQNLSSLAPEVLSYLEHTMKISKVKVKVDELESFLMTIDFINTLPYGVTSVKGTQLSEYLIPEAWDKLILPTHYSIGGTLENPDLLVRPEKPMAEGILSPDEFSKITDSILTMYRAQDRVKPINRPGIEAFSADIDYLVDGKGITREVPLGIRNLQGERVSLVLGTDSHVVDVSHRYVRNIATALV